MKKRKKKTIVRTRAKKPLKKQKGRTCWDKKRERERK